MIFPAGEILEIIFTQDDGVSVMRVSLTKYHQGINGIAGARHVKFHVGHFKFVVICNGRLHHVVAIKFVEEAFGRFEGVLRRHHKAHLIQIRAGGHEVGNDQMPGMNGIK